MRYAPTIMPKWSYCSRHETVAKPPIQYQSSCRRHVSAPIFWKNSEIHVVLEVYQLEHLFQTFPQQCEKSKMVGQVDSNSVLGHRTQMLLAETDHQTMQEQVGRLWDLQPHPGRSSQLGQMIHLDKACWYPPGPHQQSSAQFLKTVTVSLSKTK